MKIDVSKLPIDQRVRLTMGVDVWSNYDIDGQIYKFKVSDATVGMRTFDVTNRNDSHPLPAIAFPSSQIMANTWNLPLTKKMGNAIANEAIEFGVDVILGPGLNIKRLPTNGRNFEYYSEDPYLAGMLGKAYIEGVQEKHVGTCMKHYCCNNSEFSRHWASMEVDERTLREIYLEVFRIAAQAKPWSVMCAYNLVNGRRMSENGKLFDVLRDEFGFDGLVVSDWCAVKDAKASVEQGLALTMPFEEHLQKELLEYARKGELDEVALNKCAQEVVDFAEKLEAESKLRKIDLSKEERRAIALEIAREGMVLLKNEEVLPLDKSQTVFVTGAPSFRYYYGGGSSEVTPEVPFQPLDVALKAEGFNAEWYESIWESNGHQCHVGNMAEALKRSALADVTVFTVGDPNSCEYEGMDRQKIRLSREEEIAIKDFSRVAKKLVVAVYAGAAIDMSEWIDLVDAVIWVGYSGQYNHKALAEILSGKVNPSGRLSETFPLSLSDVPAETSYRDSIVMKYEEGLNVGYRYFSTFDEAEPVLFPFGYGLSYSEFEYENLEVVPGGDGFDVSFDVKNVSEVDGYEVPQVYVSETVSKVYRPALELKGFTKVFIKAGETQRIKIHLDRHAFEYYSVADNKWVVNDTIFDIVVASNVEQPELYKTVRFK